MDSGARPGSLVPPRSNSSTSGIFPGPRTPDDPQVEICTHIDTHYDLVIASLCSVFVVCGILYTYFGKCESLCCCIPSRVRVDSSSIGCDIYWCNVRMWCAILSRCCFRSTCALCVDDPSIKGRWSRFGKFWVF